MLEIFFGKQERNESTYKTLSALVDGVATQIDLEYYTLYSARFRKGGYVIAGNFPKLGSLCIKEESSFFYTLFKLREKLEQENILLCVWGSKKSVWPTGMEADMGGGFSALDRDSEEGVAKFILETIGCSETAKTDEQYEYIVNKET